MVVTSSFKFTLNVLLGCIFLCVWISNWPLLSLTLYPCPNWFMTVLEHIVTEHGYRGMAEETKSTSKGRLSSFHRISSYVCNGFIHDSKTELCIPGYRGVFVVNNEKGGLGRWPKWVWVLNLEPWNHIDLDMAIHMCHSGHDSTYVSFWHNLSEMGTDRNLWDFSGQIAWLSM